MIHNPIIPGFFPDPSICRVEDDFFIVNSSFEWFPGAPIHHSKDLMNWHFIGHALTRKSQLNLRGVPDSAGVWAPSLSFNGGQFWLVYTTLRNTGMGRPFKDLEIFLITAKNVLGPWSEPVELNSIGFDPSLFHDDDGRKWLVNMLWDFRKNHPRFAGIIVQEYDHKRGKLIGTAKKIFEKPGTLIEGPNIYKHDGWYYLMLAEGGTGWNHGVSMARSRNILGPYEPDLKPVLTSRDDEKLPLQKSGHGEIVETNAGEWYLAHLASRPIATNNQADPRSPDKSAAAQTRAGFRCMLGRETCLEKVNWSGSGWLRIEGEGYHPENSWPPPKNLAAKPWPKTPERDHFDSQSLDVTWSSLRVPADESWLSVRERPGWLRLRGRDSQHSLFDQSLIARRIQHFQLTVETCLEFAPENFMQSAGLICYYDTRTHFYLRITHDELRGTVLGIVLSDDGSYNELVESETVVDSWKRFFLRAEIDFQKLIFSASPDGKQWQKIGPVLDSSKLSDDYGAGLHFTGAMVGLCAQDVGGVCLNADFDYFDYRPESH